LAQLLQRIVLPQLFSKEKNMAKLSSSSENPFRRKKKGTESEASSESSTLYARQLRTKIRDMGPTLIPDRTILNEVNERVLDLSVKDLNDLASQLAGVDSNNPKVRNISASDLQDIEAIFYEAKSTAIQTRESGGQFEYKPEPGELGIEGEVEAQFFDGWSCCSCTPCCCCAAAVVDPLDDNEVYA
jgi:hypothetical protein